MGHEPHIDRPAEPAAARALPLFCTGCRYELSGLGLDGVCPECALAIRETLAERARNGMTAAGERFLQGVSFGLVICLLSPVLLPVFLVAGFPLRHEADGLIAWLFAWGAAVHAITTPPDAGPGTSGNILPISRPMRLVVQAANWAPAGVSMSAVGWLRWMPDLLALSAVVFWLLAVGLAFVYARALALWAGDRETADGFTFGAMSMVVGALLMIGAWFAGEASDRLWLLAVGGVIVGLLLSWVSGLKLLILTRRAVRYTTPRRP